MIDTELVRAIRLCDGCRAVFYEDRAGKSCEAFYRFFSVCGERKTHLLVSVDAYDGIITRVSERPIPYKEGEDEQNEHKYIYYKILFLKIYHDVNLFCRWVTSTECIYRDGAGCGGTACRMCRDSGCAETAGGDFSAVCYRNHSLIGGTEGDRIR